MDPSPVLWCLNECAVLGMLVQGADWARLLFQVLHSMEIQPADYGALLRHAWASGRVHPRSPSSAWLDHQLSQTSSCSPNHVRLEESQGR